MKAIRKSTITNPLVKEVIELLTERSRLGEIEQTPRGYLYTLKNKMGRRFTILEGMDYGHERAHKKPYLEICQIPK